MKRYLVTLVAVFLAVHPAMYAVEPCGDDITDITECPDEGCGGPSVDGELNKTKNVRTPPDGPAELMTIDRLKEMKNPTARRFRSDNRDRTVLKEMGEGKKIMVVAWLLTVRPGVKESCNCRLSGKQDTDNHMVLVNPSLRRPTLQRNEDHSVCAEFTPRVKLDHPNFQRAKLNKLIDPEWDGGNSNPRGKLKVRVTGQLMFDSEHYFGRPLRRENDWEIHPVFNMEYCPEEETCTGESDENWVDLDNE